MSDNVNLNVKVEQMGRTASHGVAREHGHNMDRPVQGGGDNRGASGGETLLMAWGGCFMSNLMAAAGARDATLDGVHLEITGVVSGTQSKFVSVDMKVHIDYPDAAVVEKLLTIAERGCVVGNTLKPSLELTISRA